MLGLIWATDVNTLQVKCYVICSFQNLSFYFILQIVIKFNPTPLNTCEDRVTTSLLLNESPINLIGDRMTQIKSCTDQYRSLKRVNSYNTKL